jgi:CO dehydrogenase nickel-insertion accessory protein CooC1
MKIAVGGKGGSGKTTIAGTLARVLAARGLRVVALDDDSNPNLALTVGLPAGSAAGISALRATSWRSARTPRGRAGWSSRCPWRNSSIATAFPRATTSPCW